MTLTTEQIQDIYEAAVHVEAVGDDQDAGFELLCKLDDVGGTGATIRKLIDMLRAANREALPVALVDRRPAASGGICWQHGGKDLPHGTELFTAPPAPAVPDKPRLPPHVYRDLLDMLQEAAIAYGGTQQLRAQLSSALSIHVQPDHPHTRAEMVAQPVSGGYKLVPAEPTEDMIAAAMNCDDVTFNADETFCVNFGNIYAAMLAAAPEGGNGA